jgi:hypothetical protein
MTERPQENLELIKRVLGDDYLEFRLVHLVVDEDAKGRCRVQLTTEDNHGVRQEIESKSQGGMLDAVLAGLLERHAREYRSLESIELANFVVQGLMETRRHKSGGDAQVKVIIEVKNSEGVLFSFADQSRSVVTSSARAALVMVEYFINAERAFITLYKSRQDAHERNRSDLISRYTAEMAEVVKSTSYAEVIETIKKELD